MTKISMFILYTVLMTMLSFAQNISVIKTDGGVERFNLSNIDSITFSTQDSADVNTANMINNLKFSNVVQLIGRSSSTDIMVDENKYWEIVQDKLRIHTSSGTYQILVPEIDSLYFNDEGTIAFFQTTRSLNQFNLSEIDSITFSSKLDSTVYITYNDAAVSVVNPLELLGVSVILSGADVIIDSNAGISDINYVLSGSTSNGMFKVYSDKKLDLRLNNVEITNLDGPAINIQSHKKITVHLEDGTNNILTDGVTYATPPNNEDQDAVFFSEGQLVFTGSGILQINGLGVEEHGLRSDDYIQINQGNITINHAVKDGIHANDGFFMCGGTIDITSNGDGIDGDEGAIEITNGNLTIQNTEDNHDAIKCDSTILITGGLINITIEGGQSKGLNSSRVIMISGGTLGITSMGGVVLEPSGSGFDPSYCTAIKADTLIFIDSCSITINTIGEAGRGISCNGNIRMGSGTLEITSSGDGARYTNALGEFDAYHGPCINANGNIYLTGGEITLNHSGNGGKGISTDRDINIGTVASVPLIDITTTGQPISIVTGPNGEYAEAKAITADSAITVESGEITISSADDGIKSKDRITINEGTINITNSVEGIESPNIFINGGEVRVNASDDGLNATYGFGGEPYDGSNLTVNGGYVFISTTGGDALDSNGDIFINGGIIVAHGPQFSPEVGMDVNGICVVSGGFMVVSGTNSNMTEGPSPTSTQYSVLLRTNLSISAGTIFHIENASGNSLLTFAPLRRYYSIIFSAPALSSGTTYRVYTGGSSTGTQVNGLYTGGIYSGGTLRTTFTLTNMAQTVWF